METTTSEYIGSTLDLEMNYVSLEECWVPFFGDPELIIWTSVHGILAMLHLLKQVDMSGEWISWAAHANIPCKIVNPYDGFKKIPGISLQQQRLPCSSLLIYTNWNTASCLVAGWTNPSERYARQIGSFPQGSGWNLKKTMKTPAR